LPFRVGKWGEIHRDQADPDFQNTVEVGRKFGENLVRFADYREKSAESAPAEFLLPVEPWMGWITWRCTPPSNEANQTENFISSKHRRMLGFSYQMSL
jgi:hypothetical protein